MGQGGWGSSPGQRFEASRVKAAEVGAVVGQPPRAGEGAVCLQARCFLADQRLLEDPRPPWMAKRMRAKGVAKDLLVVPGSPWVQRECWRRKAW